MNQFFEGLANQNNAEVTSVVIKDNSSLCACGNIIITKGVLSLELWYRAEVYSSMFKGFTSVDDIDFDRLNLSVSGVKIDCMQKFFDGLNGMGLSSISDNLRISDEEIKDQILKSIANGKIYKAMFCNLRIFDLSSYDEQKEAVLNHAIQNYEKSSAYTLNKYGFSESPNTKPSLEELIKMKNK